MLAARGICRLNLNIIMMSSYNQTGPRPRMTSTLLSGPHILFRQLALCTIEGVCTLICGVILTANYVVQV